MLFVLGSIHLFLNSRAPAKKAMLAKQLSNAWVWMAYLIGSHNNLDFDACSNVTCGINARCVDQPAPMLSFNCSCNAGYEGDRPDVECEGFELSSLEPLPWSEIDSCLTEPCGQNAFCSDLPPPSATRNCTCNIGFSGNPFQGCSGMYDSDHSADNVSDMNACLTQPCGGNATCFDLPAPSLSRSCSCNTGYVGNASIRCTGL